MQFKFFSSLLVLATFSNAINAAEIKNKTIVELPKITVTASTQNEEENNGYKSTISRSSNRTETPLINTPQSVSIVNQEQIRDQNITRMDEALRYVPGVNIQQGESNRDQITIRGNGTSADFFVDGARDDVQYYRDFYNIESVEVLKGPNALAFGRGGSGGVVNRVSKMADGKDVRKLILTGGSFNNRRAAIDLGGKVNNKFSLRLNSMYEKSGTFRQFGDLERYGFNPTATLNLSDKTDIKFGYEHFSDNRFNDRGIPSQNGRDYKMNHRIFIGNPNENNSDAKVDSVYSTITHDFSEKIQLRNYTRYTKNDKFYQNVYANGSVNSSGNLNLAAYNNSMKRDNFTNQTDFTAKFNTGSIKHTGLIGSEITKQNSANKRNTGYFNNSATSQTISIDNPIDYTPIIYRQSASDYKNHSELNVYGLYAQDQIEINKYLQLVGGLRYDKFNLKLHNKRNNKNYSRNDDLISPRAGIIIKPQDSLSIYSSYSVSYLPSAGDQFTVLDDKTNILKPEKLSNYELGTKWDVNPKLNLATAIYQLDRVNSKTSDPSNTGFYLMTGKSRTRGFEFSANGKITDQWQIIAGYAMQDARYLNPTYISSTITAKKGSKVALVPRNRISLWNKFDFNSHFAAAIGAINQSSQFTSADNKVRLKGFTRFDFATYYKINNNYRLQLNVENIFNRQYIETAHNNNNIQPGSIRAFKASITTDF